jgi:carbon monoxide dehydrogenase subunit G
MPSATPISAPMATEPAAQPMSAPAPAPAAVPEMRIAPAPAGWNDELDPGSIRGQHTRVPAGLVTRENRLVKPKPRDLVARQEAPTGRWLSVRPRGAIASPAVPRIEHDVTINRPASEVFQFLTKLDDLPTWQESCLSVQREGEGPIGVGTKWTESRSMMGRESEQTMEITEYEPDQRFTVQSVGGPFTMRIEHALEPAGDGTRLHVVAQAEMGGVSRLAGPMVKRQARQMFEKDFGTMKQQLESR